MLLSEEKARLAWIKEYQDAAKSRAKPEPIVWAVIKELDFIPSITSVVNYLKTKYGVDVNRHKVLATYRLLEEQGFILDTGMIPMFKINRAKLNDTFKVD